MGLGAARQGECNRLWRREDEEDGEGEVCGKEECDEKKKCKVARGG
jgi:hypothetical protein